MNTTDKNTGEVKEQNKKKVNRVLSSVYNLPSIPTIIFEITKIIEDPRSSAAQLGQLISKDQGLVTKILAVANSPLYGIPRRVSTIEFAIVILGFNHIKNIVIALSLMEAFKNIGDTKFDQNSYWEHSLLTATASKRIADDLGYILSGEIFTAGLLHDLGIPVIYKYFNNEYKEIEKIVKTGKMNYTQAEIEVLGVSHCEIAEMLIDRWNLPEKLKNAVRYHHKPSEAGDEAEFSAVIHLADYMTAKFGIGNFKWDENFELDMEVVEILKLGSLEYLESFTETYKDLFESQLESIKL
ncbi:MAG: HDOD domain-containing protein [Bacteroidetes bacterium]|nr:HDOD domain-containing protein [Bacteroidota bacterium]